MAVHEGDRVLIPLHGGGPMDVTIDGEELSILMEEDVLAVIE